MAAIFADGIFICIFLNKNFRILYKNSLKCVPYGLIVNKPSLVQIMDCRQNRRQAIDCTNDGTVYWRIYASLSLNDLASIPAWINKHMSSNVWDENTYPFSNIKGCAVDI